MATRLAFHSAAFSQRCARSTPALEPVLGRALTAAVATVLLAIAPASRSAAQVGELVAEGMITPRDATAASEVVVVQVAAGGLEPGPPVVVSTDPPRLALSAISGAGSGAGEPRIVATNLGRLAPGAWQLAAFGIDWRGARTVPDLGDLAGPAIFHVSRGEVFPLRLQPSTNERFVVRVRGPWTASCPFAVGGVEIDAGQEPAKIVVEIAAAGGCGPAVGTLRTAQTDVSVGPLAAGLYRLEVRSPAAGGGEELYAAGLVRVAAPAEPRLTTIALEEDLEAHGHRIAIEVEIPRVAAGSTCTSWEVRPVVAWAHGRDLYAELEVEPVVSACGEPARESFALPLPELDTGHYRILVRRGPVTWSQSPRLLEARRLSQRVGSRYRVTLDWRDQTGQSGRAAPVARRLSGDQEGQSAIFSFFDDDNWEVLVKVLDGCAINDHHWVFASASTDLEYQLTVEDLVTGATVSYRNPLGQASPAITDTTALPVCE